MSKYENHSELERYLAGKMTATEAHAFERKALDDPFLHDALEGAEQIPSGEFLADVELLDRRISGKSKTRYPFLSIAAAVTLLGVVSVVFWLTTRDITTNEIAQAKDVEDTEEPAKQPAPADGTVTDEVTTGGAKRTELKRKDAGPVSEGAIEEELAEKEVEMEFEVEQRDRVAGLAILDDTKVPKQAEAIEEKVLAKKELTEATSEAGKMRKADRDVRAKTTAKPQAGAPAATSRSYETAWAVQGQVKDEWGNALPGANVIIQGTATGVITDLNGNYSITISQEVAHPKLSFSAVGMNTREVDIQSQGQTDVVLTPDVNQSRGLVVTGYGTSGAMETSAFQAAMPRDGMSNYLKYIDESFRYPEAAFEAEISGWVTLELSVSNTGRIMDMRMVQSLGFGCDDEAMRLINEGPAWNPARRNGQPVESKVMIRIKF
jgi:TonB family protein